MAHFCAKVQDVGDIEEPIEPQRPQVNLVIRGDYREVLPKDREMLLEVGDKLDVEAKKLGMKWASSGSMMVGQPTRDIQWDIPEPFDVKKWEEQVLRIENAYNVEISWSVI